MPVNYSDAVLKVLFLLVILLNFHVNQSFTPNPAIFADSLDERDEKLQVKADRLLPLFDNMPSVPIYIRDQPILKSGTNTERGVAYTSCDGNEFPTIYVKKIFYEKANRLQLINILKHELTHAWLCRQKIRSGHDARFREKFKEVGGFGN